MARDQFGSPLPEITVAEKFALGKLVGAYVNGRILSRDELSAEELAIADNLAERGLAEPRKEAGAGEIRITGAGLRAFYQGRLIKTERRKAGRGKRVREIEPAKPGGRGDGDQ